MSAWAPVRAHGPVRGKEWVVGREGADGAPVSVMAGSFVKGGKLNDLPVGRSATHTREACASGDDYEKVRLGGHGSNMAQRSPPVQSPPRPGLADRMGTSVGAHADCGPDGRRLTAVTPS